MFRNYLIYLDFITGKLEKFFANQSDYIKCKKGCAKCCKNAEFPYSLIEVKYLMYGLMQLKGEVKEIVEENIRETIARRSAFEGGEFLYDCPFLVNDECTVYEYRGVVCRSFGLMTRGADGRMKIPFCAHLGLNYSEVLDAENNKISSEKVRQLGLPVEPAGFLANYDYLTDADFEKAFGLSFSEKKSLIDWFIA